VGGGGFRGQIVEGLLVEKIKQPRARHRRKKLTGGKSLLKRVDSQKFRPHIRRHPGEHKDAVPGGREKKLL